MDPLTQRLRTSPRNIDEDAFFAADRSGTGVSRTVQLEEPLSEPKPEKRRVSTVTIPGFRSRHTVGVLSETNPLPHPRRDLAGWTHAVTYQWFVSKSAAGLKPGGRQPPLRVSVLFGVGSEVHRHGVCAAVENAAAPTLLVVVEGIEPQHQITFTAPGGGRSVTRQAGTRWGGGLTKSILEKIIARQFGGPVDYEVSVLAAYSTGHYGLGGTVTRGLLPLGKVARVVIFDCLYAGLEAPLAFIRSRSPAVKIIAYVASEGGNDFRPGARKSFATLLLGGRPGIRYIDLFGNVTYHAVASARVVSESATAQNPIITTLPADYRTAQADMLRAVPPRLSVVSDARVFQAVRGAPPAGAASLADIQATHKDRVRAFFAQVGRTRDCIRNGQLLGWYPKVGEEWHDLLLIEFAWEYLA